MKSAFVQRFELYPLTRLFRGGENGLLLAPWDLNTVYQDSAGTTPAGVGDVVGLVKDISGNGNDAVQATTALKPVLQRSSDGYYQLDFDGLDDFLDFSAVGDLNGSTWTIVVAMDIRGISDSYLIYRAAKVEYMGRYSTAFADLNTAGLTTEYIGVDGADRNDITDSNKFRDALLNGQHLAIYQVNVAAPFSPATFIDGFFSGAVTNALLRGYMLINRALSPSERSLVRRAFSRRTGTPP